MKVWLWPLHTTQELYKLTHGELLYKLRVREVFLENTGSVLSTWTWDAATGQTLTDSSRTPQRKELM